MKVYHGSLSQIIHPEIEKGRSSTDFGKGFYVTTNFEQAKQWAIKKQKAVKGDSVAIVNCYEMPDNLLNNPLNKTKRFDSPDKEWLAFVVDCRRAVVHEYDMVFGAVANDKIYATITLYESELLTAEETVARLKVDQYFNQISFHNQRSVDELKFVESMAVSS